MPESKTPSTPSIETAIKKNEAAIERIKEYSLKLFKKAREQYKIPDIARAKTFLKQYRTQKNIEKNLDKQLVKLKKCLPSAEGIEGECPTPDTGEIEKVEKISKILGREAGSSIDDEAMYKQFLSEYPEAKPPEATAGEDIEATLFLTEEGIALTEAARTDGGEDEGESKGEDNDTTSPTRTTTTSTDPTTTTSTDPTTTIETKAATTIETKAATTGETKTDTTSTATTSTARREAKNEAEREERIKANKKKNTE